MGNHTLVITLVSICALPMAATADWYPGDGHKMHYPQLPDPNGWDVAWSTNLADDWQCSSTGPVEDIHIWFSWLDDLDIGAQIAHVSIAIYDDDRSGPYSKPGTYRWGRSFLPYQFTIIPYGTGDQGWYDPLVVPPIILPNNHQDIYQLNITNITQPFVQQLGTIYWLGVNVDILGAPTPIGWKTSPDHFEDDAVYWAGNDWMELRDPLEPSISLDMAFVITPEPAAMTLLAIGGFALMARRRRR